MAQQIMEVANPTPLAGQKMIMKELVDKGSLLYHDPPKGLPPQPKPITTTPKIDPIPMLNIDPPKPNLDLLKPKQLDINIGLSNTKKKDPYLY